MYICHLKRLYQLFNDKDQINPRKIITSGDSFHSFVATCIGFPSRTLKYANFSRLCLPKKGISLSVEDAPFRMARLIPNTHHA